VSVSWLAEEVRAGKLRWVLAGEGPGAFFHPGDTRAGSRPAMAAVERVCPSVALGGEGAGGQGGKLYDCGGRAGQLSALERESRS
jgi:hypothetical protein